MHLAQNQIDEITLTPFKDELANYSLESFKRDATAALSVALLTVPQAMAYSLLAGLPLTAGLFAAIFSAIIAAIFGSSRHVIVGPSNAIAILVQAGTSEILYNYYRGIEGTEKEVAALHILTQLALLTGFFQVIAAWFKLGRLTQFVSHSVVVGYISGTALAMIVNQLFVFTGIPGFQMQHSIYEKGIYLSTHLNMIHWPTFIVGVISLSLLIFFKKVNKFIPPSLAMIVLTALGIHLLAYYGYDFTVTEGSSSLNAVLLVKDRGSLGEILPTLAWPYFDFGLMNDLLPMAFALALLSIMETTSVAKSVAANTGQRLSVNQDIFGLGLGNLFSSIITGMPVSGSPSRTTLSYSLGAQTRLAAVMNGTFVLLILLCFGSLIMHIPLAALSSLLLVTAATIVNPRQFFLCMKATNSDAFVLIGTLLSCLFFGLGTAFYIGVAMSIILYLKKSAIPQLVEYEIDETGELHNLDTSRAHEHRIIRVIKIEGELFFGSADIFQTTLKSIAEDDTSTRVIILQLKNARDIDATSCLALQQLHDYLKSSGRHLVACGMTQQIWDVLSDSDLVAQIGKKNLFIFDERYPHLHMLKAIGRARELVNLPVISTVGIQEDAPQKAELQTNNG